MGSNLEITFVEDIEEFDCHACRTGLDLDFEFTMAFQPIIDVDTKSVWGHEALVRGINGESAYEVLSNVSDENKYRFDQACRVKAIALAAEMPDVGILSINFMPNAVYEPALCIRNTLKAAKEYDFPRRNIMFEITEGEKVTSPKHLKHIVESYKSMGFLTAIDDFGAGYSGLNLLTEFQPQILKLDMNLIRDINHDSIKHLIVSHICQMAEELRIRLLAEGIETKEEFETLRKLGVELYQGYLFAKPAIEDLPDVDLSWL